MGEMYPLISLFFLESSRGGTQMWLDLKTLNFLNPGNKRNMFERTQLIGMGPVCSRHRYVTIVLYIYMK